MHGTLLTVEVHDFPLGNRPVFVAMAVKQPEVRELYNKSLITIFRVEYGIILRVYT